MIGLVDISHPWSLAILVLAQWAHKYSCHSSRDRSHTWAPTHGIQLFTTVRSCCWQISNFLAVETNTKWELHRPPILENTNQLLGSKLSALDPFHSDRGSDSTRNGAIFGYGFAFLACRDSATLSKGLDSLAKYCSDQGIYFKEKWQSVCGHMVLWSDHTLHHPGAAGLIEWCNERSFKGTMRCQLGDDTKWWWSISLQDAVYSPDTWLYVSKQ